MGSNGRTPNPRVPACPSLAEISEGPPGLVFGEAAGRIPTAARLHPPCLYLRGSAQATRHTDQCSGMMILAKMCSAPQPQLSLPPTCLEPGEAVTTSLPTPAKKDGVTPLNPHQSLCPPPEGSSVWECSSDHGQWHFLTLIPCPPGTKCPLLAPPAPGTKGAAGGNRGRSS